MKLKFNKAPTLKFSTRSTNYISFLKIPKILTIKTFTLQKFGKMAICFPLANGIKINGNS